MLPNRGLCTHGQSVNTICLLGHTFSYKAGKENDIDTEKMQIFFFFFFSWINVVCLSSPSI